MTEKQKAHRAVEAKIQELQAEETKLRARIKEIQADLDIAYMQEHVAWLEAQDDTESVSEDA